MKLLLKICVIILMSSSLNANANFDELAPQGPLTAQELTQFAKTWPEFVNWAYKNDEYFNDSNHDDLNVSAYKYSNKVIKWIENKRWTVDRFFFCENQIKKTLQAIMLEEKINEKNTAIEQNIAMLDSNSAIPEDQKSAIIANMRMKIEKNKKIMNSYNITKEEIELVKLVADELWQIFDYE